MYFLKATLRELVMGCGITNFISRKLNRLLVRYLAKQPWPENRGIYRLKEAGE